MKTFFEKLRDKLKPSVRVLNPDLPEFKSEEVLLDAEYLDEINIWQQAIIEVISAEIEDINEFNYFKNQYEFYFL